MKINFRKSSTPPLKKSTPPFLLTPNLKIPELQVPTFWATLGGGGGDTVRTVARMKILGVRMGANTLIFNKVGTKNKKTWFLVQFYLLFPKTFSKDCPDEILQLRVYNRLLNNSIITIYFAAFSGKILKFEEACSLNRFWVVITVLDFLVWSTHKSLILMVKMFHI